MNDKEQLPAMVETIEQQSGQAPEQVLADSGYCSEKVLETWERKPACNQAIDLYLATERQKHGEPHEGCKRGRLPKGATRVDRMRRKVQTRAGAAVYAARKGIVEPVFGQIKQVRGFRQFLLRGLEKVRGKADNNRLLTVTDERGTFRADDVLPGKYVLMASHVGYLEFGRPRLFATLSPGQDLSGVVLRLTPACSISGHVVDEQGDPLVRAQVQVSKRRPPGSIIGRHGGQGPIDDHGEFRVFDLAPGKYYVSVNTFGRGPDLPTKQGSVSDWRYPVTYYPGVTSAEGATPIEVRPGEEPHIELVVAPVRAVRVRGRVLGARPADSDTQTTVMLSSDNFSGLNVRVKADGSFEIPGVLPGKHTLTAFVASDDEKEIMSAQRSISVGEEGLDNVELTLEAAFQEREKVAALTGNEEMRSRIAALRQGYRVGGTKEMYREQVKQLQKAGTSPFLPTVAGPQHWGLAIAYAHLGENDRAFEQLQQCYRVREFGLLTLKNNPDLDPLRSDPRFADLVRRIGLPQ